MLDRADFRFRVNVYLPSGNALQVNNLVLWLWKDLDKL